MQWSSGGNSGCSDVSVEFALPNICMFVFILEFLAEVEFNPICWTKALSKQEVLKLPRINLPSRFMVVSVNGTAIEV